MKLKRITLLIALLCGTPNAFGAVNVLYNLDGLPYADVMVNGSPGLKFNIVYVGDGFTSAEQSLFNSKVNAAVNALWNLEPYASHMCAFNIYRVNVASAESGIDHPMQGIYKDTELDCRYGNANVGEAERCIQSDSPAKCYEAAGYAPAYDAVFTLVNDAQWGGCASGQLVYSSIHPDFNEIITHELGHRVGGLADEYTCYVCDGSDDNGVFTDPEPFKPNVTKDPTCAKWADLIVPGTPMPTTVNIPNGVVGGWEGGMYKALGIYRPQFICQMRDSEEPFCRVCKRHLAETMETYEVEPPNLYCSGALFDILAFARKPWAEVGWQLLLPQCLTCPPREFGYDDVVYVLDGLPDGFQMQIVDQFGNIVGKGVQSDNGLTARFDAQPSTQYYAQVFSDAEPTGQLMDLQSQLSFNGEELALP